MLLLFDIGNTHTHLGLANGERVMRQLNITTKSWFERTAAKQVGAFVGKAKIHGVGLCSVVPKATPEAVAFAQTTFRHACVILTPETIAGIGIDYPQPRSIGADRLANAVAVRHHYGAPSIVVGFGTAVAFDVVDRNANYVGGIIAPGLSAMTSYLHEKTALLPAINIREINVAIGKSTEEAMLIGAVHGYRGLIREIILEVKRELKARRLPVIATGGYAELMAAKMPEITAVEPLLTLEGLRLVWESHSARKS